MKFDCFKNQKEDIFKKNIFTPLSNKKQLKFIPYTPEVKTQNEVTN